MVDDSRAIDSRNICSRRRILFAALKPTAIAIRLTVGNEQPCTAKSDRANELG